MSDNMGLIGLGALALAFIYFRTPPKKQNPMMPHFSDNPEAADQLRGGAISSRPNSASSLLPDSVFPTAPPSRGTAVQHAADVNSLVTEQNVATGITPGNPIAVAGAGTSLSDELTDFFSSAENTVESWWDDIF